MNAHPHMTQVVGRSLGGSVSEAFSIFPHVHSTTDGALAFVFFMTKGMLPNYVHSHKDRYVLL